MSGQNGHTDLTEEFIPNHDSLQLGIQLGQDASLNLQKGATKSHELA